MRVLQEDEATYVDIPDIDDSIDYMGVELRAKDRLKELVCKVSHLPCQRCVATLLLFRSIVNHNHRKCRGSYPSV